LIRSSDFSRTGAVTFALFRKVWLRLLRSSRKYRPWDRVIAACTRLTALFGTTIWHWSLSRPTTNESPSSG
jgi:hypothetical protein